MSAQAVLEAGLPANYGTVDKDTTSAKSHRSKVNSWMLTGAIILSNTFNVPALNLSAAVVAFGGWLPAFFGITFGIAMNWHISIIVWRLYMCVPHCSTYTEVIGSIYAKTPEQQRFMVRLTAIVQYGYTASVIAFNLLVMGQSFGYISQGAWHACLPTLVLIGLIGYLPFGVACRQIGTWRCLTWMSFFFAVLFVLVPMWYLSQEGPSFTKLPKPRAALELSGAFDALSIVCFMLSTQYIVVEIAADMEKPEEFPNSYAFIAGPYQWVMSLSLGLGGYWFLGAAGSGMLLDYLPFGTALTLCGIFVMVCVVVCQFVNGSILWQALHVCIDPVHAGDGSPQDWKIWSAIVICGTFTGYVVANGVPFFTDLCALLGTTFAPIGCYLIPLISYAYHYFDSSDDGGKSKLSRISIAEWTFIAVELVVSIAMLSYGTVVVSGKIMSNWHTFGYPFQCHCELLWNTCSCAAARPGMTCLLGA